MKYVSVREIAEIWGINVSLVRRYCAQGRIPGAMQTKDGWRIPEDAVHPERTVLEHTEEPELPELARKLKNQKKKRNYHGLYDYVVIDLTYSSSRMASCRLTRQQVESIFRKGKVRESFEPMKVSDLIEVLNHCECVDYSPYHEMDIRHFCDKMNELYRAANPETRLKSLRQKAGLSQRALAELSNVPYRMIQQYEQRQKNINHAKAEYLIMLAQALCCDVEDLIEKVSPNYKL